MSHGSLHHCIPSIPVYVRNSNICHMPVYANFYHVSHLPECIIYSKCRRTLVHVCSHAIVQHQHVYAGGIPMYVHVDNMPASECAIFPSRVHLTINNYSKCYGIPSGTKISHIVNSVVANSSISGSDDALNSVTDMLKITF